jgi:glycerate kinase
MAEASGLTLLKAEERNPLLTTSLGTGQMIGDALDRGARKVILGIGGSATNDAGIGMASALGYTFLDSRGETLKPIGQNLVRIQTIKAQRLHAGLSDASVIALCDVTNPLSGPEGAAYIYGPQKGADPSSVKLLDAGLKNFRNVVLEQLKTSVDFPGAGAAGGLGAGAKVFLNAYIQKGVSYLIETTALAERIRRADLIITGEGKIDQQTFSGKVISEILRLAAHETKPVVAICGVSEVAESKTRSLGIRQVIALVDDHTSAESAIRDAADLIAKKVKEELRDPRTF